MSIKMRWLGTACFEIVLPNKKTIVIDPYLDDSVSAPITSDKIEGCDYIFLTHGHYDHVLDVGKLAKRFDPKIFCSDVAAGSYPDPSIIEVAQQAQAYITLLQVLPGRTLRGLEEQTASLAMASGCKIVVPQHYDPLFEGSEKTDLTQLKKILEEKTDIIFQELVPGRWYSFD